MREITMAAFTLAQTEAKKPKYVDTPASHLRNALQISLLLAGEIDQMIGNPGYQDEAKKALKGIDKRIRAALEQLEGTSV